MMLYLFICVYDVCLVVSVCSYTFGYFSMCLWHEGLWLLWVCFELLLSVVGLFERNFHVLLGYENVAFVALGLFFSDFITRFSIVVDGFLTLLFFHNFCFHFCVLCCFQLTR